MKDLRVGKTKTGLGLFAARAFKRGERVIEYVGEIISTDDANTRGGKYLFEINSKITIDGKARSNVARYINHGCKPNCEARTSKNRVFIHAARAITPGEELTYDYGTEYVDEFIKPIGCRCNSCMNTTPIRK
ncbi:MAG: SET domain-containing protein [Candidatus Pacebacteria bacterium]|jgi:SET domain-containing protein|nr:SET domain-containing protein [Candidatus Paceibacterota bacterium]